jgi:hypothetical protein
VDGLAKLKPYSFWIATGIVLLAMLIYFGVFLEARDGNDRTVEEAVSEANGLYGNLQRVDATAKEVLKYGKDTPIPGVPIAPEDKDAVGLFIKKHLMHKDWQGKFEAVLKDYQGQIASIQADLAARSAALSEPPLSTEDGASAWYQDYKDLSAGLLRDMYQARRLIQPAGVTGERSVPDLGQLEEKAEYRDLLGLHTASGEFPGVDERRVLTARFRVLQALWAVIGDVRAPMLANPQAVPGVIPPGEGEAALAAPTWVQLSWAAGEAEPIALPGAEAARMQPFTLMLRGHPSALLATAARLETIHQPVLIRLGTTWKRRQQGGQELLGLPGESMDLTLELAYLDFGIAAAAVAAVGN